MLSTSHKIAIARCAYRCLTGARSLFGFKDTTQIRRRGIRWAVDLREGIDLWIYLLGGFEIATLRLYQDLIQAGDTVLDVGANIGSHTLPLSRLVGASGRVVAFEPTAFAIEKLRRNMELNTELANRIVVTQTMLADRDDFQLPEHIFSSWPLAGDQDLHEKHKGRLMTTAGARVMTLDGAMREANIDRIDFIKLDVDGYEFNVIAGGAEILASSRPVILMELAPYLFRDAADDFTAMLTLLRGLGYSMKDAATKRHYPLDARELDALIPDGVSRNVLLSSG